MCWGGQQGTHVPGGQQGTLVLVGGEPIGDPCAGGRKEPTGDPCAGRGGG